jgi:hypothetical protein
MITPEQFLRITKNEKAASAFLLGTVDAAYVSGRPKIIFDGETVVSGKAYPYLTSYAPAASDRVLLARVGGSFVVLGKVV